MTRMLTFDTPKRLIKKMSGSGITGGSNVCAASGPHVAMEETDVGSFPHNHGIHYNQSTAANTTSHKGCHLAKASVRRESLHLMPLTTRTATVDALTGLNQTGDCSCPLTKYIYCISSVQIMRFIWVFFFVSSNNVFSLIMETSAPCQLHPAGYSHKCVFVLL